MSLLPATRRGETPAERRNRWFSERDYRCAECGRQYPPADADTPVDEAKRLTIGHVIPRSLGGPNAQWNLVALCYRCNQLQGNSIWPHLWGGECPPEYRECLQDRKARTA